jgi:hypothetical protein
VLRNSGVPARMDATVRRDRNTGDIAGGDWTLYCAVPHVFLKYLYLNNYDSHLYENFNVVY